MHSVLGLLAAGFSLGLAVAIPLGPVGAATIREGLERGTAGALALGLGAATVDFFYLTLVYLGVVPLLLRLPWLVPTFYLSGAYLMGRMAFGALKRAWEGGLPPPARRGAGRSSYLAGLGLTLLNPATIVSWLGMGGAFASAYLRGLNPWRVSMALVSVGAGSAAWFAVLAVATGSMRLLAGERPWVTRVVNLVAGVALGAFGVLFLAKGVATLR